MSEKHKKRMRGAIAVFLSVIMLGMTVFECMLIDESRIIAAKSSVSGAGELALNSAMTSYDQVLYEVYGVFANSTDADLEKNVEAYFERTIRGAGIDGSFTDVNNMLGLLVEDMELTNVTGSALSEPDVLKGQLLEFMKFRGPVNIGFGLLEKIKTFGDLKKQTEAVTAQMEFEKELENLQDACENVYAKAKELLNTNASCPSIHGDNSFFSFDEESRAAFEKGVANLVKNHLKDSLYHYASGVDFTKEETNPYGKNYESYDIRQLQDVVHYLVEKTENKTAENQIYKEYVDNYNAVKEKKKLVVWMQESRIKEETVTYYNWLDSYYEKLKEYMQEAVNCEENVHKLYQLLSSYEDYWEKTGEEQAKEDETLAEFHESYEKTYKQQIQTVIEDIKNLNPVSCIDSAIDAYEAWIVEEYNDVRNDLITKKAYAETLKTACEALLNTIDCMGKAHDTKKICCLARAISTVNPKKEKWKKSIDELPDGNTKTSMEGSYQSEAETIDLSKKDELQKKVKQIYDFMGAYITYVEGFEIKYYENSKIIDTEINPNRNQKAWLSFLNEIKNSKTVTAQSATVSIITLPSQPSIPEVLQQGKEIKALIEEDEFYQYLQTICSEEEEATDEEKEAAEDKKDALMEKGNEDTSVSSLGEVQTGVSDWDKVYAASKNQSAKSPDETKVENEDDNKKIADNATKSMQNTVSFLSKIGDILTDVRDDIYLTEYAAGMFSCYTTGILDGQETEETLYTIAGRDENFHKLGKDYNMLYRSEQEYILWGNQDQTKNINHTLTAIFGIRFALNTLYAFTGDAEIKATTLAWATAIAGWTGFGVPIVQSVLKVALALAESTYDISLLKQGYAVPLYKTQSTWVMKPTGITKEFIEGAADKAAGYAKAATGYVFDKVDSFTTQTIEQVTESVSKTAAQAQEAIVNNAVSTIVEPFQKLIVTCADKSETAINTCIDNTYNEIMKKAKADQTTLGELEVFLLENYGNEIKTTIQGKITETKNAGTKKAEELLDVEELTKKLTGYANASELVQKLGTELQDKVSTAINEAKDKAEENVSQKVSEVVSEGLGKLQGTNGATGSVTNGFALTVSYQEYVHIFLLLKAATNSDQYLTRIGQLIQINMQARNASFALNKSYTMLELHARVKVPTNFIGRLDSFLDKPVNGSSYYTLQYKGLQGY